MPKYKQDIFQYGKWVELNGTFDSLSAIRNNLPRAKFGFGPDGHSYAITGSQFYRIREMKRFFAIYNAHDVMVDDTETTLEGAKNSIQGQTLWFAPDKDGTSFGIGSDGYKWTIKEVWRA